MPISHMAGYFKNPYFKRTYALSFGFKKRNLYEKHFPVLRQKLIFVINLAEMLKEATIHLFLIDESHFSNICTHSGFKLAIHESWFADRICLFADQFKQFLWNSRIKTFLMLEFMSSGKPKSSCLHLKLDKSLISYSKKC